MEKSANRDCARCLQLEARITELRSQLMATQIAARLETAKRQEQNSLLDTDRRRRKKSADAPDTTQN